jgi:hypothetical protein
MAITARSATLGSRATASRGFLGKRVAAASNGARYVMKAGNWLPGSDFPAWIPEDMPGYTSPLHLCSIAARAAAGRCAARRLNAGAAVLFCARPQQRAAFREPQRAARPLRCSPIGGPACRLPRPPADIAPRRRSAYGFDPLGLGKDPASLKRFQEAEVIHCRWAMLGAAGCLAVELLGFGNWYDAPQWVSAPPTRKLSCPPGGDRAALHRDGW